MDLKRLTFAVAPVVAAAGLGGLASRNAPETYARLAKPAWAPPASAFGPVWTALYAGTAVAGWLLHPDASRGTKRLHLAQLALNAAWPLAFFGVRDKRTSLTVIVTLDALLATELAVVVASPRPQRPCSRRTWPGRASPLPSTPRSASPRRPDPG